MREIDILNTAYQLRCLTKEQILRTFFPNDENRAKRSNTYADRNIRKLINDGYMEKRTFLDTTYYQTTRKGYTLLKKQDVTFIGSEDVAFDEFKPNSKILLMDKQLAHQEHLNNFPLNLIRRNPPLSWIYRDDMFINKEFKGLLHPDGVLECENECFFLEMDMGTETPKQLKQKWMKYRRLVATGNIRRWDAVTVLFLQKPTRSLQRKETIINTIQETIDDLTDGISFDIRIGSEEELFRWFCSEMERKYITGENRNVVDILEGQGYAVSKADGLDLGRAKPKYYVRKQNGDKTVKMEDGVFDEFLLDINDCHPQSVLRNATLYNEIQLMLQKNVGRKMRYVILENEENESSQYLQKQAESQNGTLFTTTKRLTGKEGSERFYKMLSGSKYHYNNNYTKLIIEE